MYNQGYPQSGNYPPQQGQYPPQQGQYPPQQGAYPPQQPGQYPPQQGAYPPQQGAYPPQQGQYPPQQGAYPPPQQGAYPPQQGAYPQQQPGQYPPQQPGQYPPPQGQYPPPQQGGYPSGGREPVYKQINVGRGIDMNEFNNIVGAVKQIYMSGRQPMATACAEGIRRAIGGDWFVFISDVGIEDYDFSLTRVKGGDFMAFSLDSKKFQVCRIR